MAPNILIPLLLLSPPLDVQSDRFSQDLHHAVLTSNSHGIEIAGYDATGEVIGVLSFWREGDAMYLSTDYGDGFAEYIVTGDDVQHSSDLAPEIVSERAQLLANALSESQADSGGVRCECVPCCWGLRYGGSGLVLVCLPGPHGSCRLCLRRTHSGRRRTRSRYLRRVVSMLPAINTRRTVAILVIVIAAVGNTVINFAAGPILFAVLSGIAFPIIGLYAAACEKTPEQYDKAIDWLMAAEAVMLIG